MSFTVLTTATAPEAARPLLDGARQKFGFVPNLLGVLAHSPAALTSYLAISEALAKTRLTPGEQQIVAIAVSAENGCAYCVAAHSTMALMVKTPAETVVAARAGQPAGEPRLEALRRFAAAIVATHGHPGDEEIERFLAAGFDRAQILDVLAIVALKTLSNYTNHLAATPLDTAFEPQRWEPAGAAA